MGCTFSCPIAPARGKGKGRSNMRRGNKHALRSTPNQRSMARATGVFGSYPGASDGPRRGIAFDVSLDGRKVESLIMKYPPKKLNRFEPMSHPHLSPAVLMEKQQLADKKRQKELEKKLDLSQKITKRRQDQVKAREIEREQASLQVKQQIEDQQTSAEKIREARQSVMAEKNRLRKERAEKARLRRLETENDPKVKAAALEQKQQLAEEKRKQELEKKRDALQKASKKRKEQVKARELEREEETREAAQKSEYQQKSAARRREDLQRMTAKKQEVQRNQTQRVRERFRELEEENKLAAAEWDAHYNTDGSQHEMDLVVSVEERKVRDLIMKHPPKKVQGFEPMSRPRLSAGDLLDKQRLADEKQRQELWKKLEVPHTIPNWWQDEVKVREIQCEQACHQVRKQPEGEEASAEKLGEDKQMIRTEKQRLIKEQTEKARVKTCQILETESSPMMSTVVLDGKQLVENQASQIECEQKSAEMRKDSESINVVTAIKEEVHRKKIKKLRDRVREMEEDMNVMAATEKDVRKKLDASTWNGHSYDSYSRERTQAVTANLMKPAGFKTGQRGNRSSRRSEGWTRQHDDFYDHLPPPSM